MSAEHFAYRGMGRSGTEYFGVTTTPPAEFVAAAFRKRWRSLTVTRRSDGEIAGAIEVSRETARRTWWAES